MNMEKIEIFAEQLNDGNREFFLRMNEVLENEGLIIRHGDKSVTNRVTYFPDTNRKQPGELKKQQPLVLRYTVDNSELTVDLKLNFIDCYTSIVEKMPEHIKELFRSIRYCGRSPDCGCSSGAKPCGCRRTYSLDGEHYYMCSYNYYLNPDVSNPADVEYYAKIIKAEVLAAKERKKHNTAYYV